MKKSMELLVWVMKTRGTLCCPKFFALYTLHVYRNLRSLLAENKLNLLLTVHIIKPTTLVPMKKNLISAQLL